METLGMFRKADIETCTSEAEKGKTGEAPLLKERLLQARSLFSAGPCSPAPVIGEQEMKRHLLKKQKSGKAIAK